MFENATDDPSVVTTTKTWSSAFEGFDASGWLADLPADLPAEPTELVPVPAVDPAIYGIENEANEVHAAAARGIATPTTSLPHFDRIQDSFGAHDISGIQSHVGGSSASEMGAKAFAAGSHVVFDREPDLHTAAHEVAHVIQQARGVNLYGGVGEAGDAYERAADAVADRVVAGESAADLLGAPTGGLSANPAAVQRKEESPSLLKARADGNRAHTISAHLRLGAMKIQHECDIVAGAINADTKDPQAVMNKTIKPAYQRVTDIHRTLHEIWSDMMQLAFKDSAIQAGFGIFNTAKRRFVQLTHEATNWASGKNVNAEGVSSAGIDAEVKRYASLLGVDATGPNAMMGKEDSNTTDEDLIKETVSESLFAVENSVNALALTMREEEAVVKKEAPGLAHRAFVDLKLLDTSIPAAARTSQGTALRVAAIERKVRQAFRDASTYGLDKSNGHLMMLNGLMPQVKAKIDAAKTAKPSD